MLIDLVKAFDRVPRELLWRVMLKQGVPPKIVSLLKALHATVKVQFEVGGVKKVIDSIIGVKQGDLLGPELFIFFMAAVMETWRLHHDFELCVVRSKNDFVLTGRRPSTVGDVEFSLRDSMYADDAGLAFCSRRGVEVETPKVVAHFARWGMEIHVGKDGSNGEPRKDSKSEVLFCAAAPTSYNNPATYDGADLSDIKLPGGCFMPVVDRFKYLGSYLNRDCSDGLDVDSRIESAGRAFGALRKCLFSSRDVSFAAKRAVYTSLILSILLYGCECWALTERLLHRLRVFHAQCVRACDVSCHSQARVGAPHHDWRTLRQARSRLHRLLHRPTPAGLARACQQDGFQSPTSSHALIVGASRPADRVPQHDVWAQHPHRARQVPHRPLEVARARRRSLGLAPDAGGQAPARRLLCHAGEG